MTYLEEPQDPPTTTPELIAAPNITEPTKQLRYFIHSLYKRAGSEITKDQGNAKRVQAMIVQIILGIDENKLDLDKLKNSLDNNLETTFPTKVIASIHIPCTYKEAINDSKYIE
jgi:CO dehydrogenase/acetyl-CoA synthase alpha subunit